MTVSVANCKVGMESRDNELLTITPPNRANRNSKTHLEKIVIDEQPKKIMNAFEKKPQKKAEGKAIFWQT